MDGDTGSRIERVFCELKKRGEKALITFITAGDPGLEETKRLILELERAGADIIELGVPFSDPMADGPTIQASSERAIRNGTTLPKVLSLVREIRQKSNIPIVLFGYYNPVFTYGLERFARDVKRAGVDGILVVDLPPEEAGELKRVLKPQGVDLIFLLTPTSNTRRLRVVTENASGFVYYVSVTGVTGVRKRLSGSIKDQIKRARRYTHLPIGVGFGISTPQQARKVCRWADGVIVGSAIINILAENRSPSVLVKRVGTFVRQIKEAIKK